MYYSIGEVAQRISEPVSLVRFWSEKFSRFIKPERNAKGNRLYSAEDLEILCQIHYLVKDTGLSLDGAARRLTADRASVEGRVKVLESLKAIRAQLVEVKDSI